MPTNVKKDLYDKSKRIQYNCNDTIDPKPWDAMQNVEWGYNTNNEVNWRDLVEVIVWSEKKCTFDKNKYNDFPMIVNGAAANTNIAVSGILTTNTVVKAFFVNRVTTSATILGVSVITSVQINVTDITAGITIPSDGNIRSTTNTTGGVIVITWNNT